MLGRCIYAVAAILAAAGLYACCSGAALTWDGAYQFCYGVREQRPYVYGTRFHSWLLWLPFVGLSRLTHNAAALRIVFGLPFALAPVAGLLVSWWVVRRHAPGLIVWAVFGIAIAPLPGQIFIINDSIFQQHLFWPVLLGVFVPPSRSQRIVLALLALVQLSHPIGILLLALGVTAAALSAWRNPPERRRLAGECAFLATLAIIGAAKLAAWPDQQAADEFHLAVALNRWSKGVYGAPMTGLRFFWVAAACVALRGRLETGRFRRAAAVTDVLALFASAAGAAVWLNWAADEHRWAFALDYRRWLVPLSAPFFALCVWEGCLKSRLEPRVKARGRADPSDAADTQRQPGRSRARLCHLLASTFAGVLFVQSLLWGLLTHRLAEEVKAYPSPVVPRSAVPWVEGTPLQHWGTMSYLAAAQGPTPRKLFLYDTADGAALGATPPRIPLAPDDWGKVPPEPGSRGWFDYRPLVKEWGTRNAE